MTIFKILSASTLMSAIILAYSAASIKINPMSTISPNYIHSHFAKVNGIRLHYLEIGKGPLIILLHGWPETSVSWNKTMHTLSSNYRLVAPDLRGLGNWKEIGLEQ